MAQPACLKALAFVVPKEDSPMGPAHPYIGTSALSLARDLV